MGKYRYYISPDDNRPHIRSYHIFRKDSGKPDSYERTVYGVLLMVEDKGFQEPVPSGAAQREDFDCR